MMLHRHPLTASSPGTQRELVSLHYGPGGTGRKALIQASLHADEVPGLLVAQHLRLALARLEAEGMLQGEVVLVPFANPIGLAQEVLRTPLGRFDLGSGENFNRRYADLVDGVLERLTIGRDDDVATRVARVRAALRATCRALPATTELQSLRRALLSLAIDADVVLDLHSDNDAVLHLYTATPSWPSVEPLARLLGTEVNLLATASGEEPFDEACSMVWSRLAEKLSTRFGRAVELPIACTAVTVELRGEADVNHEFAARDAAALLDYLRWHGVLVGGAPDLPPLKAAPRPLAGCMPVFAPHSGVIVYLRALGTTLRRGEQFAELIDPAEGAVTPLVSPVDGVLFARELRRFAKAGIRIAKVAGTEALRSGKLLSD